MKRYVMRWEVLLLAILVAELLIFGMINPRFLRPSSLLFGTSDFVQVGIVAVPLTLVIIAGGIDVSFASTVGLAAIAFGIANFFGLPLPLSLLVGFATGALATARGDAGVALHVFGCRDRSVRCCRCQWL